jgi:hypothetical protein
LRKGGTIMRITAPSGLAASKKVQNVARTSDGGGVSGLAFAGSNLYLAESGA